MEGFFRAQSVAVVGVSNSQGNLGRAIAFNLMEFRYQGCIYLVGPKGGAFLGHKIYPSLTDIPDPVELAAVLVPAAVVPEVLRQCGIKGIRRVVVESAGFRELGEDRAGLEEEILQILESYGMRMIGPNCIGTINRRNGLAIPFMPFKAEGGVGRVSIITQSGGVGATMINAVASENIGFNKFASIGNKLNVDENDLLEHLIQDDSTAVIFCYFEGIANGRRLMDIAFRSSKPIIVHKSNTGEPGSVIARSHSASLATDDRVVDAGFKQCGIIRTRDQQEAVGAVKAFSLPIIGGNRLAIISRSGGHAVMAADAAEEFGFALPAYPEDVIRTVTEASRAKVIQLHNPMDLGDLFDLPLYLTLAVRALDRKDVDGLLFIHNYQGIFDALESRRLIVGLGEVMRKFAKPIALCVFTTHAELEHSRKAIDFPIFTDPREAVRALYRGRDRHRIRPLPFSDSRPLGTDRTRVRSELGRQAEGPIRPETLAAILNAYDIPLIDWAMVEDEDSAVLAARKLGFPVVLKTANHQVAHKTDVGGVHMNLSDEASVRAAYRDLLRLGPLCLSQKMSQGGLEFLLGGRQEMNFGPVVLVGLGGIYVEIFKETGMRVAPIGIEEADRLIGELHGAALLDGVRGQEPLDRKAFLDMIVRISWLLHDFPEIQELDLNPVRVFPRGCLALDWRAVKNR